MNQQQIYPHQVKSQIEQHSLFSADWPVWLAALICVWFGLGAYGVLNNNEGLYANIPFDMLSSGDFTHWIIPHLNGLPYMEKPPMMYWLTAIAFLIFGQAEWVVRLVPALAGLACTGLILYFGKRINRPQMGRLAALMFISGLGVMCMARALLFDMLLTAFVTAALIFVYFFVLQGRKRDLRIAYACVAFGVLTKGFVAIIFVGLVVVAWLVLNHGWSFWKHLGKWFEPIAIGLFFLITMPWFVAASLVEPVFPWFFFVNEHVLRFLGEREPHDYYSGAWWYYLPRMVIYLFPWSLLLPIALFSKWKTLSKVEHQEVNLLRKMLMLGWVIPLLFFSTSSNKANYYVIVVMPFAVLHLALLLEQSAFLRGKKSAILGLVIALLTAALALTIQLFPHQFLSREVSSELIILGMTSKNFAVVALWILAGLSLIAALVAWRFYKIGLTAYVVIPFLFVGVLLAVVNVKEPIVSDRAMARFIQRTLPHHTVYLYRQFEQHSSLSFYLKKSLSVIDSVSNDLYWGNKLRPENTIMVSSGQFEKQFEKRNGPAAVLVPDDYVVDFSKEKWSSKLSHSKRIGHATLFY